MLKKTILYRLNAYGKAKTEERLILNILKKGANMVSVTHEDYLQRLNDRFDYIVPLEKYQGRQKAIKHLCSKCGNIWTPRPGTLLNSTSRGCPKCSKIERNKEATKTTDQYSNELIEKGRPFLCVDEYKGANIKIIHQCVACGHKFMQTPHVIIRTAVCPMCSDTINTTEKYKELLRIRRPDMEVLEEYQGRDVKILHRHSCGYEYKISPNHVFQSKGGCENCYRERRRKDEQTFLEQMEGKPIKIIGKYQGARKKIQVTCPEGHVYESTPTNLLKGFGCPLCSESGGEYLIRQYLIKHNIKFIPQMRFDDLRDKNKLSYDFYLPDYNLLIEFQGKQHHKANKKWGGESRLQLQLKHDAIKKQYAQEHGYNILYIWYYDQNKIEDILNECLKSKSVETAG